MEHLLIIVKFAGQDLIYLQTGWDKSAKKARKKETTNIYELLVDASEKEREEKRAELLRSVGVKEFFEEGSIRIDMKCKGVECKYCIEVCPTKP